MMTGHRTKRTLDEKIETYAQMRVNTLELFKTHSMGLLRLLRLRSKILISDEETKDLHMFKGDKEGNVTANGKPLKMSSAGRRSSPTGFAWGYGGSGPYALAHSMLTHLFGRTPADYLAQDFKWEMISNLPNGDEFELAYKDIREWYAKKHDDLRLKNKRDELLIDSWTK